MLNALMDENFKDEKKKVMGVEDIYKISKYNDQYMLL